MLIESKMIAWRDICNLYVYLCYKNNDDINDYEQQLLDKCFDKQYEQFNLGETVTYSPPFLPTGII